MMALISYLQAWIHELIEAVQSMMNITSSDLLLKALLRGSSLLRSAEIR